MAWLRKKAKHHCSHHPLAKTHHKARDAHLLPGLLHGGRPPSQAGALELLAAPGELLLAGEGARDEKA